MQSDKSEQEPPDNRERPLHIQVPDDLLSTMSLRLGLGQDTLPRERWAMQLEHLQKALQDPAWQVRVAALLKFSQQEEHSMWQPVVDALQDERAEVRAMAARALGTVDEQIPIQPLLDRLHDTDWQVRAAAARTLGKCGQRVPLEDLEHILHTDTDEAVRAVAAQALGMLEEHAPVEPLVRATHDDAWLVREAAVLALGKLGPHAPLSALQAALNDVDMNVRIAAQEALQQAQFASANAQLHAIEHPDEQKETITEQLPAEPGTQLDALFEEIQRPPAQNIHTDEIEASTQLDTLFSQTPDRLDQIRYVSLPMDTARHSAGNTKRFIPRAFHAGIAALVAASLILASLLIFKLPQLTKTAAGNTHCPPTITSGIGCAFFTDSIQPATAQNNQAGFDDTFQIELHTMPDPAAGKSYYAWLLGDQSSPEATTLFLGKLSVNQGDVHFSYRDPQHTNLLSVASAFLITEEDASVTPLNPSPDHSAWRYFAQFSTTPDPSDTENRYSLLDHLHHLLTSDPALAGIGLQGGLDSWLLRNTYALVQWAHTAQSAETSNDGQSVHNQLVSMLYDLDGNRYVQIDVPPETPPPTNAAQQQAARVALLEFNVQQQPPGYLKHIGYHLNAIAVNPHTTAYQKALAIHINTSLNALNAELVKAHDDARSLVRLTNAQLLQSVAQTTLHDLETHVEHVYNGWSDNGGRTHEGTTQLYKDIQNLAVFAVTG